MCGKTSQNVSISSLPRYRPTGVPSTGSTHTNNTLLFPWKLHDMLDAVERCGQDTIVSWLPDGKAFKVHDTTRFVKDILPQHFKQTKYKSFQRQLNLWKFARYRDGPEKGAYSHPYFVKGHKSLCRHLCRQNNSGSSGGGGSSTSSPSVVKKVTKVVVPRQEPSWYPKPALTRSISSSSLDEQLRSLSSSSPTEEDTTHCSLLDMAAPMMTDLDTNEMVFPPLPDDEEMDIQETTAAIKDALASAVYFEGCQFFLMDGVLSEEEWLNREQPSRATASDDSSTEEEESRSSDVDVLASTVTPPSSPPRCQDDDGDESVASSMQGDVRDETDPLLPALVESSEPLCAA